MVNSAYSFPVAPPQKFPPGGRRVIRHAVAMPCTNCGDLIGRGYPDCVICAERADDIWWADWRALLDHERIRPGSDGEKELAFRLLAKEPSTLPWTCIDWALWLVNCDECGGQLGSGELGCGSCAAADAGRWAWDYQAMPDTMTANEHALRVAVAGLRAPHRHREVVRAVWRLALPFLLLGQTPTTYQVRRIRTLVLAGRYEELAAQDGYCAMVLVPDVPWRVPAPS